MTRGKIKQLTAAAASRRIALLIAALNYGGTETQVTVLANELARFGYDVSLLVFYPNGPLENRVSSDVKVHCFERRGRWDMIRVLRRVLSALNAERPDVLYAFLPGANVVACLVRLRLPKLKVAWGVRASNVDLRRYDWATRLSYWLERRLSRLPDLIVSNSFAGRRDAVAHGFPDSDRFIVIPNGIDVEHFRPDAKLRDVVRAQWGVLPDETLIGIVARLDPMKDYPTFLEAAAKLTRRKEGVRFVSVGAGPADYAEVLKEKARGLGLNKKIIWAGLRSDLAAVYNALDLLVSSSAFGEGFSNVLGEAMACGIPCVATDVGDAREILGDGDAVAPPSDPEALVTTILALLARLRLEEGVFGARLRQRIIKNFSLEALVRRTSQELIGITSRNAHHR